MRLFDIILHPTDFTEDSDQAFHLACSVARDQSASVVVVHVLPPESSAASDSNANLIDDDQPIVRNCREQFRRMKALAYDVPISFRLVFGYSVGAILNVSHDENADVIVIASHQHSRFNLQLHGSVAEGVLRQSHCPVICLRQSSQHCSTPLSSPAATEAKTNEPKSVP